jgi:hypothetical protein
MKRSHTRLELEAFGDSLIKESSEADGMEFKLSVKMSSVQGSTFDVKVLLQHSTSQPTFDVGLQLDDEVCFIWLAALIFRFVRLISNFTLATASLSS